MTFGALIAEKIIVPENINTLGFKAVYIDSWFNVFSILTGMFFAALCAFLASVLLIGESNTSARKVYVKKSSVAIVVVVILGFITLIYGYFSGLNFINKFLSNIYSIISICLSGLLLIPLWKAIRGERRIISRFFAGLQVVLILTAAMIPCFPNIIHTSTIEISILDNMATGSVINVLGVTLIIGGLVILPGLFHLLKSFKMIKILDR